MSFVKNLKCTHKILVLAFCAFELFTGTAHAAPVTYQTIGSSGYFTNKPGFITLDLVALKFSGQFEPASDLSYMGMYQTGPAVYDPTALTLSLVGIFAFNYPAQCGRYGCPEAPASPFHLVLQFDDASLLSFHAIPELSADSFKTFNLVGSVPVPAAAWLFGSSLLGLAGVARRKFKTQ